MKPEPTICIVVAIAENGVIGRENGLPWRLSTDMKRFKAITMGKPVVMGRKTFQSIGRPLPGRANIVVSRDPAFAAEGVTVVASLGEAVERAKAEASASGKEEVCIIGGGEIYRQALPLAKRLYVTRIAAQAVGDTTFPPIDPNAFESISEEVVPAGEKDDFPTRHIVYERQRP